jgi:ribosome-binding ATPase YchF (GTP1/OBG family)
MSRNYEAVYIFDSTREEFVANGGWKGAREKGAVGSEGKEYVVAERDVMLFRFNV